ncbi:MAG TPA: GTP-binding protein [Petrotogaceae bacterium]|nr:GTP-binding protein [Petrotogaceae bacterium]HNY37527.1 GTP-binding protein [Petrotogaceae bacterium]HOG33511.1 GTP-binding protein [Petrotogaceae bacterium]HPO27019.1 GTP-binding protein [Petrotogaceae bacterium]HPX15272.1 GTP-binding protein [Petrotogaceae bacterium]
MGLLSLSSCFTAKERKKKYKEEIDIRFFTFSGPPSSGKTSVIIKTALELKKKKYKIAVVKFDCLATDDDKLYAKNGIESITGLSGNLCPDHFFISNIDECFNWAYAKPYDILISESAGLCNRCSPHIEGCTAVCVIDNLLGINTPRKIGPMLKTSDITVITKSEIVSQAEKEIFAFKIRQANPNAIILHINGITGQGANRLSDLLEKTPQIDSLEGKELRASMPSALCSYCMGETFIGKDKQKGNVRRINFDSIKGEAVSEKL